MFSVSLKKVLRLSQFWGQPVFRIGSLWKLDIFMVGSVMWLGQFWSWVSFVFRIRFEVGSVLVSGQF